MSTLDISFSPDSLKQITAYAGFPILLSQEVQAAMDEGGKIIVSAAQSNTWTVFAHPTGHLASTIHAVAQSPYEIIIQADAPYSARREYGFNGVDSLGRRYNDPAKPYLGPAMDTHEQDVLSLLDAAVERALERMTTGGA